MVRSSALKGVCAESNCAASGSCDAFSANARRAESYRDRKGNVNSDACCEF
jgi:hypothetical protein